jgi:FAD/FMN-containing dehydrogenase
VGRTLFVDTFDRAVAETALGHLRDSDAPMRAVQVRVLGGAMARVPNDATAFAHRDSRMLVNVASFYNGPEDRAQREAWVVALAGALQQDDPGAYVAFLNDEGQARVHAAYPEPAWTRLIGIKQRYDPDNVFRINQNVRP